MDRAQNETGTAEWTKLRQVTRYDDMPERFFSLDPVRSDRDLVDYVARRDRGSRRRGVGSRGRRSSSS